MEEEAKPESSLVNINSRVYDRHDGVSELQAPQSAAVRGVDTDYVVASDHDLVRRMGGMLAPRVCTTIGLFVIDTHLTPRSWRVFTCEYRIFEYAASDLQIRGDVILVAMLLSSKTMHRVCAFVVSEWQELVAGKSQSVDRGYIEDFIHDLCQINFFDRGEAEQIFEEFRGLSVGPLRTGNFGTHSYAQLSPTTKNMVEGSNGITSCDALTFSALLNELISHRASDMHTSSCI